MLYFLTLRTVLSRKHRGEPKMTRRDTFFVAYSTMLLCCTSIFVATEAAFGQEMWVVHADYPGGQDAYLGDFVNVWYQTLGTAASIFQNFLSDALLVSPTIQ